MKKCFEMGDIDNLHEMYSRMKNEKVRELIEEALDLISNFFEKDQFCPDNTITTNKFII